MTKPLQDLKILLTRQNIDLCSNLQSKLTGLGAVCQHLPLFAIESNLDAFKIWQIKRGLSLASLVIVVSSNAAKILVSHLKLDAKLACATIGPSTAQVLQQSGLREIIFPRNKPYNSAGLLHELQLSNLNLANRYIIVLAGEDGNSELIEALEQAGAVVELVEVYRRIMPDIAGVQLQEVLQQWMLDVIVITCVTSLINLKKLASQQGILWQNIPILVVSQRIRDCALALGFSETYTAASMTDTDIISAIIEWHSLKQQV